MFEKAQQMDALASLALHRDHDALISLVHEVQHRYVGAIMVVELTDKAIKFHVCT
jgi:hypothetical protein